MWTGVEARSAKGTDREPTPLFRNRCTLPPYEWVPSISRPVNRMGYAAGSLSHQANRRASARKAANRCPAGPVVPPGPAFRRFDQGGCHLLSEEDIGFL